MVHHFHKHKILFDENFAPRINFPRLNGMFDVKHVRDDLKKSGLPDLQVYELAVKLKRIIVTFNVKHFKELANRSWETGVIGISASLPTHQIDTKLTSLLVKSSEKALLGKFTTITGETSSSHAA